MDLYLTSFGAGPRQYAQWARACAGGTNRVAIPPAIGGPHCTRST